jgi:hypothetical protein
MGVMRTTAAGAVLVTGLLGIGTTTALAEETIGEVIARIDGEAFDWRVLGPDASGTDYNTSLQAFGPMQMVSVMGFPPGEVSLRGTIQLTLTLMGGTLEPFEQEVIYAPDGMSRMWMSLEGEELITVERFEATESGGEVSGSFSGRVCLKESMLGEPDADTCKSIDGTFSSRLPVTSS